MGYPNLPDTLAMVEMSNYSSLMASLGLSKPLWELTQEERRKLRIPATDEELEAVREFFTWAAGFPTLTEYSAGLKKLASKDDVKVEGREIWKTLWTRLAKRANFNNAVDKQLMAFGVDPMTVGQILNRRRPQGSMSHYTQYIRPAFATQMLGPEAFDIPELVLSLKADSLITVILYLCWHRLITRMRRVENLYDGSRAAVDQLWEGKSSSQSELRAN